MGPICRCEHICDNGESLLINTGIFIFAVQSISNIYLCLVKQEIVYELVFFWNTFRVQ
jgi:hypothetical protein